MQPTYGGVGKKKEGCASKSGLSPTLQTLTLGFPLQTQRALLLQSSSLFFVSHTIIFPSFSTQTTTPCHHVVGLSVTPIDVDDESLETCELHSCLKHDSNHLRASTHGHCHHRRQSELESSSAATSLTRFLSPSRGTRAEIHVPAPRRCSTSPIIWQHRHQRFFFPFYF